MASARELLMQELMKRKAQQAQDDQKIRGMIDQQERIAKIDPSFRVDISPTLGMVEEITGGDGIREDYQRPEDVQTALRKALQARATMTPKQGYVNLLQQAVGDEQRQEALQAQAGKKAFGETSKLRSEWRSNPTTKDTQDVAAAYEKVKISAENPSAAGDISLIFGYMKMIDPGSTVREGEFATAAKAGGVHARIRNLYNRVRTGERLTPEQRSDFVAQAEQMFQAQMKRQKSVDNSYIKLANRIGANAGNVVLTDMFQGGQQRPSTQAQPAQQFDPNTIDYGAKSLQELKAMRAEVQKKIGR